MESNYSYNITKLLIDSHADVNAINSLGNTALIIAAGKPKTSEVIKLFVNSGADINYKTPTEDGITAILEACRKGARESVNHLACESDTEIMHTDDSVNYYDISPKQFCKDKNITIPTKISCKYESILGGIQ